MTRRHRHVLLLVEDEGVFRDQLEDALRKHGFEVVSARHGRKALEMLSAGIRPCVIVLDLLKPGLAGNEFRRAQHYDPELRHIPVALLAPMAASGRPHALLTPESLRQFLDVDRVIAVTERWCPRGFAFNREATRRMTTTTARRPPRVRAAPSRTKPRV